MSDTDDARSTGWVTYSSIVMVLVGVMTVVLGVLLYVEDEIYVTGPDESVVIVANVQAWGAVLIALGVLSVIAGFGVLGGRGWARVYGIVMASLTLLSQIGLIFGPQPLFSLIVVAMCALVIYGLAAHGGPQTIATTR